MSDTPAALNPLALLPGQTVLILGGSSGIDLATARLARAHGAQVILTGRDADRLEAAARSVGAVRWETFNAFDHDALVAFLASLDGRIDHIFVGAGNPGYSTLADIDLGQAPGTVGNALSLMVDLSRLAPPVMNPGGALLFMSGTGARHPAIGLTLAGASIAASTAAVANLALEIAPTIRINLVAAGFVDTPLSARLLGDGLEARREVLRNELPIRRVVTADDVAALVVHLMSNTAITGAVFDIDGGQQVLPSVGA